MFTPVIIYYLGSIREGTHFTGFHVHSSFQLIINLISIVQLFSVSIFCNFSCFRCSNQPELPMLGHTTSRQPHSEKIMTRRQFRKLLLNQDMDLPICDLSVNVF